MTNFRIQLLSDNNVVLVQATGHETEVFLPQLHNERFALRNIIRSRRPHARYEADEDTFNQEQAPYSYINQRPRLTTATAGLAPIGEGPPPGGGRRGSVYSGLSGGGGGEGSNHGRVLQFTLKLISNEKVVLVESRGHESEIFLPYLFDQLIAMKRVTANELIQCSRLKSRPQLPPVVDLNPNPPLKKDNLFFNPSRFFIQNNSIETNTPEPGKQVKPRRKRRYPGKYAGAGDQHSGKR
ncbi:hypothetical protein KR026_002093 [Drosophila bipectinata]|nr:hypothetical protein KR026_002093 [Drosophila bipectinata]